MTTTSPFAVGQEVLWFPGRRGDGPFPAVIVSVGQKYVKARCLDWSDTDWRIEGERYHIGSGDPVSYNGTGPYIRTQEFIAARERLQQNLADLATHGVKFDWQCRLSDDLVEVIADAVRKYAGEQS